MKIELDGGDEEDVPLLGVVVGFANRTVGVVVGILLLLPTLLLPGLLLGLLSFDKADTVDGVGDMEDPLPPIAGILPDDTVGGLTIGTRPITGGGRGVVF